MPGVFDRAWASENQAQNEHKMRRAYGVLLRKPLIYWLRGPAITDIKCSPLRG